MGLDMYLNKMPRYKNTKGETVNVIENYLDWQKAKEEGSECANGTFKEWCGYDGNLPPQDRIDFYKQFYKKRYSTWDTERKYGWYRIIEQVGYWRKANHIHDWFVNNIQDGEDDCSYHREVTKEDLEKLLDVCETVLKNCELVDGIQQDGEDYKDGKWVPYYRQGKFVKDTSVAEELLPTTGGFFFGSTNYDEYYVDSIKNTIDIITKVLKTTDFETDMIYYVSSW